MRRIDASGIRKVFDLAARMTDPINLSIGQPHFDTPEPIKQALNRAVAAGKNAYSQTQGIVPLIDKIQQSVIAQFGHSDRQAFVTSGTSGGLMLALEVLVNPHCRCGLASGISSSSLRCRADGTSTGCSAGISRERSRLAGIAR